jgi:hypothetical protein
MPAAWPFEKTEHGRGKFQRSQGDTIFAVAEARESATL